MPPPFTPRQFLTACPVYDLRLSQTVEEQAVGHGIVAVDLLDAIKNGLANASKVDNWPTVIDDDGIERRQILVWVATQVPVPNRSGWVFEVAVRLTEGLCRVKPMAIRQVRAP